MPLINRWLEYLNQKGIRYSHSVHHREQTAARTADAERVPAHELAKTVVYKGDSGFGLAVVAADDFVDLAKLRRVLGLYYIRLPGEEEFAALFPDCEPGAMPPFGPACDLPVIVDTAIIERGFVALTVASHRDTVRMSFDDFARLTKPRVASIAQNELCIRPGFETEKRIPC
jgi:Ala-tRNA(Pro) deacylase